MSWSVDKADLGTVAQAASTTSVAMTTTSAVAAGAWVFVGANFANVATVTGFTAGALTGAQLGSIAFNGTDGVVIVGVYAPAGLASSTTLTVNFSTGVINRQLGAASFLGGDAASAVHASSTGGTTSAAWSTGNLVTTVPGCLCLGAGKFTNNEASAPTAPSVEDSEHQDVTLGQTIVIEHRIEASTGTFTVAGTMTSVAWAAAGVAMTPASSRPPLPVVVDTAVMQAANN